MSELKKCPFCGTNLTNEKPSKLYVHEKTGCIMDLRAFTEDQFEEWNTRKPVDDVLERLEKELRLSEECKEYARSNNPLQYERCDSYSSAISNAIGFVKEVMGYD